MTTPISANSSAAQTVQKDLDTVNKDAQWIHDNKGTASKQDLDTHIQGAEKDWEKFTADSAGLQQSPDANDKLFANQSYGSALQAFGSTQADYKEVLGGRLNADLQSGDSQAGDIKGQLSSLIDQGNAAALHSQTLLNQQGFADHYVTPTQSQVAAGANPTGGPVAGGTASPTDVSQQSNQLFNHNITEFNTVVPGNSGS